MNVLLTGSNGFLGSHILSELVKSHKVFITLRKESNTKRIKNLLEELDITVFQITECDELPLEDFFKTNQIEMIVHCATDYARKGMYLYRTYESNVVFPMKLIEIGLRFNLKYFINTYSYFNKSFMSYNALPAYSKTKKIFLKNLKSFSRNIKIPEFKIINMRLEHVYGENDNDDKFTVFLTKKMLDNESII